MKRGVAWEAREKRWWERKTLLDEGGAFVVKLEGLSLSHPASQASLPGHG